MDAILVVRVLRMVKLVGNIERSVDFLEKYLERLVLFRFKAIFGTFSKVLPTLITYLRVMFVSETRNLMIESFISFRWYIIYLQ